MVVRFMDKERQFTKNFLKSLIDAEEGYLFTNDEEYLNTHPIVDSVINFLMELSY